MAALHIQDIFNQHLTDYRQHRTLTPDQSKACHQLMQCRTPVMGGFHLSCTQCKTDVYCYHACRNRHCTRCQQQATEQWCLRQQQAVLPVRYFHLVFTLPHELNGWARLHPRLIYGLVFNCAWDTLHQFAKHHNKLGGQPGMTAILHTWGQTLDQHIHLHCLVPGGVINTDLQWRGCKGDYLFPVKALSRVYRGKFISALREAANQGKLHRVTRSETIPAMLRILKTKAWIVYSKACLHQPETVIRYLGRYTRRIAISDSRLQRIDNTKQQISFRYTDYRDKQQKIMTLSTLEFMRRYLQHVLPSGFVRIRHYGWLSNACRKKKLVQIRQQLKQPQPEPDKGELNDKTVFDGYACPVCGNGWLCIVQRLSRQSRHLRWQPG